MTVTVHDDVHRVRRQVIAADVHGVACLAINHIGVDIAQVVEITHKAVQRLRIGGEMTGSRVLDEVAFRPRLVHGHDIGYLRGVLTQVEIE